MFKIKVYSQHTGDRPYKDTNGQTIHPGDWTDCTGQVNADGSLGILAHALEWARKGQSVRIEITND